MFLQGFRKGILTVRSLRSYWALLFLLVAVGLSAFFSIDRYTSIFGSFNNYNNSVFFWVALIVLAFVVSNVRVHTTRLLSALMLGTVLSSLFALYTYYGGPLPYLSAVSASTNLVGATNHLLGLFVLVSGLSLTELVRQDNSKLRSILCGVAFVLTSVYVIATLNVLGIVSLLAFVLFVGISNYDGFLKNKTKVLVAVIVVVLLSLVNSLPMTRSALGIDMYNNSPRLSMANSWYVAASALRQYPLSGSGLGTFATDFSVFRPINYNAEPNWAIRLGVPFNDMFLVLATAGIVGGLAFLFFVVDMTMVSFGVYRNNHGARNIVLMGLGSLVVMLLLGSNLILMVLMFLAFGLLAQVRSNDVHNIHNKYVSLTLFVLVFLLAGLVGFRAYKVYAGQYYYMKSQTASSISDRYNYMVKAMSIEPWEDVYRRDFVATNLILASALSKKEGLNDSDKTQIAGLLKSALTNSDVLVRRNRLSAANWETRGMVYRSLLGVAQGADQQAITSYQNAIKLEPTNPRLYVEYGGILYRMKNYQGAVNQFATAVGYKPDYANAHYNLAHALKDGGAFEQALTQIEIVGRLVPQGDASYEKVQTEIAEFRKLRDDAVAKQQAQKLQVPQAATEAASRNQVLDEPLVKETTPAETDVTPQEGVEVEGVTEETTIAPADGSEVDEGEGQTDAPLSKPAGE